MSNIVKLYDKIYSHYRVVNSLITLFLDKWWRKKMVDYIYKLKSEPISICDVCCGTGDLTEILVKKFNNSLIYGVDANINMIEFAEKRDMNAVFINCYVSDMPFEDERFDIVTISFATRNLFYSSDFEKSICEIKRILKKGGFFVSLETSVYSNRFLNLFFKFFVKFMIKIVVLLYPSSKNSYNFLKKTVLSFKAEDFKKKINDYFGEIYVKKLFPGCVAIVVARK